MAASDAEAVSAEMHALLVSAAWYLAFDDRHTPVSIKKCT